MEFLYFNGAVATFNGMGCQQEIAQKILDFSGDQIPALKGDQPTMQEKAAALFKEACPAETLPQKVK